MFIWLFHRISGVTLIVLFSIKILTSYFLFTKDKKPDWALSLHRHPVLDILILVLFTFHSLYGLRTVAIDLGYRNEKRLFWVANVALIGFVSTWGISRYGGSKIPEQAFAVLNAIGIFMFVTNMLMSIRKPKED